MPVTKVLINCPPLGSRDPFILPCADCALMWCKYRRKEQATSRAALATTQELSALAKFSSGKQEELGSTTQDRGRRPLMVPLPASPHIPDTATFRPGLLLGRKDPRSLTRSRIWASILSKGQPRPDQTHSTNCDLHSTVEDSPALSYHAAHCPESHGPSHLDRATQCGGPESPGNVSSIQTRSSWFPC